MKSWDSTLGGLGPNSAAQELGILEITELLTLHFLNFPEAECEDQEKERL